MQEKVRALGSDYPYNGLGNKVGIKYQTNEKQKQMGLL